MDGIRRQQLNVNSLDELLATNAELAALSGVLKETILQRINGLTPAQTSALLGYIAENLANKGVANGYAALDVNAKVPKAQLPTVLWEEVNGKPVSAVADIDSATSLKHTHNNKVILDAIEQAFTSVLKAKLDSVADGATKTEQSLTNGNIKVNGIEKTVYTHPATHPATVIEEDATHKFFTDAERAKLLGIEAGANLYVHPATHDATIVVEDTTHRFISDSERAAWNAKQNAIPYTPEDAAKKGIANGYAALDVNGIVPTSQLPNNLKEIKVVSNIADRDALVQFEGLRAHVIDATGDVTVASGWAEYISDGVSWTKTAESESIDVVLQWANIVGRPNSAIAEIDDAVAKKHAHANQVALDGTQEAFTTVLKNKIHDSNIVGTKAVDEAAIADKKVLGYNAAAGKLEYKTIIDDVTPSANTAFSSEKINAELVLKANDNAVVHIAGDEVVTGNKTFNSITVGGVVIGAGLVDGKDISNLTKADIVNFDSDVLTIIRDNYDVNANGKVDAAEVADSVAWAGVTNRPISTVTDIDDAVTKRHDHMNKAILDQMTQATVDKFDGIEAGATKTESSVTNGNILINGYEVTVYTHPASHAASMITDDATHRFTTDSEKNVWNAKQNAIGYIPENSANRGTANGYATLDANGLVPISQIPSTLKEIKVVNTIAERDAIAGKFEGMMVHVIDATGDATVLSGWAEYICDSALAWIKVSESESIDITLQWANVIGKPTSVVSDIDDAVAKKHVHNNKVLLDAYTQTETDIADAVVKKHAHANTSVLGNITDIDGVLSYKGSKIFNTLDIISDTTVSASKTYSSTKIEDIFSKTNLANEFVRQTVLSAPLGGDGNAAYLQTSAFSLNIGIAASVATPIIVSFANGFNAKGAIDYIEMITVANGSAWTIPANTTAYLYVDRNTATGALTYGYTTLEPVYSTVYPTNPSVGQHFFHTNDMKMYEYSGGSWVNKQRVFLGSCYSGAVDFNWIKSMAIRGRFESGWFGVAPNNTYSKDHNLGMNPKRLYTLVANSANLECYQIYTSELSRNTDKGFIVRSVNDKTILVSTFKIEGTAQNECYVYDEYGNTIGLFDRMKVIVERGW